MRQQVNLYQPIFRREQKKFSAVTMGQALGLLMAATALVYGYTALQVARLGKSLKAATAARTLAAERLVAARRLMGQTGFAEEFATVQREIAEHHELATLIAQGGLGNTTGYSRYFEALRATPRGLWITGFTVDGDAHDLQITGETRAPDLVPLYLARLAKTQAFAQVSFGSFTVTRAPTGGTLAFSVARPPVGASP